VAPSVTKRGDLLDPAWLLAQGFFPALRSGGIERFPTLSKSPGQRPSFPITGTPRQQNRQLVSHRRNQHHIYSE
jgi:hypothetical protein